MVRRLVFYVGSRKCSQSDQCGYRFPFIQHAYFCALATRPGAVRRIFQPRFTGYFRLKSTGTSITPATTLGSIVNAPSFKVARVSYKGEVRFVNLNTNDLLRSAQIYARDLFLLNVTSRQERRRQRPIQRPIVIMPRKDLILVSFGNVRAVVGLNELYIMDAHQPVVQEFAHDISSIFREEASDPSAGGDPPELLFLDELLRDTVDTFSRRLRLYEPIVENFLEKVSQDVYSDTAGVHQLVPIKDSLQSFEIQVKQSVDTLASLLNNDDMMLDLLLTEQAVADKSGGSVDFERQ